MAKNNKNKVNTKPKSNKEEILKENVRVKFEDDDGYHYKKYKAEEVKLIKESETEEIDLEEKENEKELEELEKLAKDDILVDDDM